MSLNYIVRIAQAKDIIHSAVITHYIDQSSKDPSNGVCKRSKDFIEQKIVSGDAVIAVTKNRKWVGFCFLEKLTDHFVYSGNLIISRKYKSGNIAKHLSERLIELAMEKYPDANYFGLKTSYFEIKVSSNLGYKPVTYSEITQDEQFWDSCKQCRNYSILESKDKKNCLCTAMLFNQS